MGKKKHPCRGCVYAGKIAESCPDQLVCDYLLITGHARSKICPGGKDCTVREEGIKRCDPLSPRYRSKADKERLGER